MLKNKADRIVNFIKATKLKTFFLFVIFCLEIVSFYYCICKAGFVTHDELQSYAALNDHPLVFKRQSRLGGMILFPNIIANYLQFNSNSIEVYRLYTLCGILLALLAAYKFITHLISKEIGLPFSILFFAFLQIGYIHNGAISFSWSFQYAIAIVFLCLDVYLYYCETNEKKYYVISSILFLVSIMLYEAFYMFSLVLFLFALISLYRKNNLSIINLIKYLWLPAFFGIVYLVLYAINISQTGNNYGGIIVDTDHTIFDKIRTMIIYSLGMLPLRLNEFTLADIKLYISNFTYESLFIICKNLLAASSIAICLSYGKTLSGKKYLFSIVIITLCIFMPCVLYGISKNLLLWADSGTILYGGSFYSYFFIIALIILIFCLIYKKIRNISIQFFYKCLVFSVVFAVSFVTEINNKAVAERLDKNDNKYVLFDTVVQSDYFKENVIEGAQIFAPEMVGIHLNLKTLDTYVDYYADKKVSFYNDPIDINYDEPVYMLRFIENSSTMMFGRIYDNKYITDEIYINSMQNLESFSLCGLRDYSKEISSIEIGERLIGNFGTDFMIPLQNYVNGNETVIRGNDIRLENLELVYGNVYENKAFKCLYGSGIYQQEEFGRWVAKNSELMIENKDQSISKAILQLEVATAVGEEGKIQICTGDLSIEYIINGDISEIEVEVPLQLGYNEIEIRSFLDSAKVTNGDKRDINLRLQSARCIVNNNIFNFE